MSSTKLWDGLFCLCRIALLVWAIAAGGCSSAGQWDQRNADFKAGRGQYARP